MTAWVRWHRNTSKVDRVLCNSRCTLRSDRSPPNRIVPHSTGFSSCASVPGGDVIFRSTAHWHSYFVTAVLCAACIPVLAVPKPPLADAHQAPGRPFTVADEIGLAHFGDPNYEKTAPITLSPDRRWVTVHVERGLLSQNLVEDELRVYDMTALREYVVNPKQGKAPAPIWSVRESTYREGALITNIRWLRDSRGLAFLLKTSQGKSQLVFSDLRHGGVTPLSGDGQDVIAFDVRDATHYVYAVRSPVRSPG